MKTPKYAVDFRFGIGPEARGRVVRYLGLGNVLKENQYQRLASLYDQAASAPIGMTRREAERRAAGFARHWGLSTDTPADPSRPRTEAPRPAPTAPRPVAPGDYFIPAFRIDRGWM
jgi:hypothetical protein